MDNRENKVSKAYHNMLWVINFRYVFCVFLTCILSSADSMLHPPKWDILFKALWHYIPERILHYVKYIPTREYSRFRRTLNLIENVSRGLVNEKREAYLSGDAKSKDIMTLLGMYFHVSATFCPDSYFALVH